MQSDGSGSSRIGLGDGSGSLKRVGLSKAKGAFAGARTANREPLCNAPETVFTETAARFANYNLSRGLSPGQIQRGDRPPGHYGARHSSQIPQPSTSIREAGNLLRQHRHIAVLRAIRFSGAGGMISTTRSVSNFMVSCSISRLHVEDEVRQRRGNAG